MAPKRRLFVAAGGGVAPPPERRQRVTTDATGSSVPDPPPPSPGTKRFRAIVLVIRFFKRPKRRSTDTVPVSLSQIGRLMTRLGQLRHIYGQALHIIDNSYSELQSIMDQNRAPSSNVDNMTGPTSNYHNQERLVHETNRGGNSAEAEGLAAIEGNGENKNTRLRFLNRMKSLIFQDDEIKSKSNEDIKIGIFDGDTRITSGPLSKAKVEIVALQGNFPYDASDTWTAKEFDEHRAGSRYGKGDVLAGEGTTAKLINGECNLGCMRFREGSCVAPKKKCIVAARVCDDQTFRGRVQEAVMNPVAVRDRRSKSNQKSDRPELKDGVNRLVMIAKNGKYLKRLKKEKIFTVEHFLKALNKDPAGLARLLQIKEESKAWEKLVKHAQDCRLEDKPELTSYRCEERNVVLFFDCVHHLVGAAFGDCYTACDKFNSVEKVLVDELKGRAYDHLDGLRPDYVMTETDNIPRPLNMDVGAGPSYMSSATQQSCDLAVHQVVGAVGVDHGLAHDQFDPNHAIANSDPGPSSSIPTHHNTPIYQGLTVQDPLFSASPNGWFQVPLGGTNFSIGASEGFCYGNDTRAARLLIEDYSDVALLCGYATEQNPASGVLGMDHLEMQGDFFRQGNDTFEALASPHINTAVAQQLAMTGAPGCVQSQMEAPLAPSNGASEASAFGQQCQGNVPRNRSL